jgi:hypothetical protein
MPDSSADEVSSGPPPGSRLGVEDAIDGITITVPPLGIWRAARWLFVFGLLWCAILGWISSFFVRGLFAGKTSVTACVAYVVLSVMWLFGLAFLLGSVNMGRRRAVLAVVGDRLLILLTGPFGRQRREWSRDELRRIEAAASDMDVNGVPVPELHVQPVRGKRYDLLAGRDRDELRWLAARLRRALGM